MVENPPPSVCDIPEFEEASKRKRNCHPHIQHTIKCFFAGNFLNAALSFEIHTRSLNGILIS